MLGYLSPVDATLHQLSDLKVLLSSLSSTV